MLEKRQTIRAGSLKNLRNIYKINWSVVTEVDKSKTSYKYRNLNLKLKKINIPK